MNRALTMLAAAACAALAISSAGLAADWTTLPFQLAKTRDAGRVQFSIQQPQDGKRSGQWSQSVALGEFQGLSAAQLTAAAATPIRFALARPAGRFTCSGSARSSNVRGTCRFAADAVFSAELARRGLGRPSLRQSYKLAMSDFRPDVLDALAAAGYPRPTIEQSVSLGIFQVRPAYIRGLADAGYRLGSVDDLVGFKIHKVTPELIRSYRALGVRKLEADDLMAMAIHQVTPAFIQGFAKLGYRDLPADELVQLKIFNVTPADVRALQAEGVATPSADQLVELRLFGGGRRSGRRDD